MNQTPGNQQNGGKPLSNRLERLEGMLTTHAQMLNQLAPLMAQVAQIATTTSETVNRHDQSLTRIEEQTYSNAVQQQKNASQIADLCEQINQLAVKQIELQTITHNNSQAIAQLTAIINRIAQRQENFQIQLEESVNKLIQTIDYQIGRTEELVRRASAQSSSEQSESD
jgi:DNA-binding FrmR family transcriptional regulator